MSRVLSTEAAIAFIGTDHQDQIVDDETLNAANTAGIDTSSHITPPEDEGTVMEPTQNALNGAVEEDNPFLDTDVPVDALSSLESIREDLEGLTDKPFEDNIADDNSVVDHHVGIELSLDEESKVLLDNDIREVIAAEPEHCGSLESIILCKEVGVSTLLSIVNNTIDHLKRQR